MSTSQSTPPTADITFQGPSSTSETKILNTSSTTDASFHISAFNNKATFHNTFPTATDSNFQSTTPIDKTTIHSTASPICESFHTPASSIDSDFYNLFHFAQSMSSSSNSPCQSTTSSADYTYHKNDPSPDPPYQSSTTSSYLSFESTTSSTDLLYPSNISSSNPSLQQSEVPPNPPWQGSNSSKSLFEAGSNQNGTILCDPIKKCSLTSTDSMNACTFSLDPSNNCATASSDSTDLCTTPPDLFTEHSSSDSDLQSLFVRDEIDEATPSSSQNTIRLSIEDEYGTLIKQNDQIFRDELRKIFLDHQGQGFTLLDSGIVVTRSVTVENTTALVKLRDGSELGMTVSHSNLFLYYQLGKQFYITEQLNEHWYYVQDRITKVVMLMKKVPVTSNWVKLLHNFLLLPKYPRLLTTYAAITNRDGFILFLMEGRPVLGLGIPPLRCAATRQICILGIILFLRYCKINNVLPRQTADSILYTHQGLWFDPSSLDGNDDLYELRKSLKSFFSIFLCRGQQELDLCFQVLLDIAHQLLEEDSWWPSQLRHASLAFSFPEGSVPFSLPGVD
ncbi:streptococcal hemagglutinin-like [Hyperolius riggenbachi]|uniref:streptococcal hemagglutinin-like n=1 Tax=Hyperolius riggenbachi TaxID=752182 RepID=UPI0035A286FC